MFGQHTKKSFEFSIVIYSLLSPKRCFDLLEWHLGLMVAPLRVQACTFTFLRGPRFIRMQEEKKPVRSIEQKIPVNY